MNQKVIDPDDETIVIHDVDRDSLWALPLVMMPLETQALKRTRIVKNTHLEGVIEMFDDHDTGKGHVRPKDLKRVFDTVSSADLSLLQILANLQSYDVYSLRITLRQNGVEVENYDDLKLSDSKQEELQLYMRPFLERLVLNVFEPGPNEAENGNGTGDWLDTFHHSDPRTTRQHLRHMAGMMDIPLHEVPVFLQEYGDVYLSIAYYRQCLEGIDPQINDFLSSTEEIVGHQQLQQDYTLMKACDRLQTKVSRIRTMLGGQFAVFGQASENMWSDMSAEKFGEFRDTVQRNHTQIGGLLCALAVKMNAWHTRFPDASQVGPMRRADFILTDMGQGW